MICSIIIIHCYSYFINPASVIVSVVTSVAVALVLLSLAIVVSSAAALSLL